MYEKNNHYTVHVYRILNYQYPLVGIIILHHVCIEKHNVVFDDLEYGWWIGTIVIFKL